MTRDYIGIANQYCDDVLSGKRVAGELEILAVKRYQKDIKRQKTDKNFVYRLDPEKVHAACYFIETLFHVKGDLAKPLLKVYGTNDEVPISAPFGLTEIARDVRLETRITYRHNLILDPWQVFVAVNIFGWADGRGKRRFTKAYVEVAKKNGKSTFASAIGNYMLIADGEAGAEVYSAAATYDQASIVWADAKAMIIDNLALQQYFGVGWTQYEIRVPSSNSTFKPLATDKKGSQDGKNVHCGILDEIHAHKDSGTFDIVSDGVVARSQPLIFGITTAGSDRTGVCWRERTIVASVLKGKAKLDRYFGIIFTLDSKDDWRDRKNWPKANPSIGVSFDAAYLDDKFKEVLEQPSKEPLFRQKSLNQWVGAADGWITANTWDGAYDPKLGRKPSTTLPKFGAGDLASKMDLAGHVAMQPLFVDDKDKVHWAIFSEQYINERVCNSKDAINGEKRPDDYLEWKERGWLTMTEGNTTDFNQIQRDVIASHHENPFYEWGFDPFNANQFAQNLVEAEINAVEVPQRVQFLSPAMRWIEELLMDKRLHHNGDPCLAWCVTNIVVAPDNNQNIFPRKPSAEKKIDAGVGMIIAASRAMFHDDPEVMYLTAGESASFDDYMANFVSIGR